MTEHYHYLFTVCLSFIGLDALAAVVWSLSLAVMVLISEFGPSGLVSGIGDSVKLPSCWFGDQSISSLPSAEPARPGSNPCSQVDKVPYPLLSTVTIPSSEMSWGWTVSCGAGVEGGKLVSVTGSSGSLGVFPDCGSGECICEPICRFCNCTNALISSCMSWTKNTWHWYDCFSLSVRHKMIYRWSSQTQQNVKAQTHLYLALVLLLLSKNLLLILLFHQLKEMQPPALFQWTNTTTKCQDHRL